MDSRLRSSRPTFRATSTSSGTGCRQGAIFLRRCGGLCHSVGAPQVQADAPSDQGGTRLVRPATSGEPPALRPLATMSWQRPNIGSRVNREVHARFWERLGVKLLRATRQTETNDHVSDMSAPLPTPEKTAHWPAKRLCAISGHPVAKIAASSAIYLVRFSILK